MADKEEPQDDEEEPIQTVFSIGCKVLFTGLSIAFLCLGVFSDSKFIVWGLTFAVMGFFVFMVMDRLLP